MYYDLMEEEKLIQEDLNDAKVQINIERNTKEYNLLKEQLKEELRQGKNVSVTYNKLVKTINGLPDAKPTVMMKRAIDVAGLAATSKAPYLYGQMRQGLTLVTNRLSHLGKLDKGVSAVLERAVLSYEKRLPTIKDPEIHRGCSTLVSALKNTLSIVKNKIISTPTVKRDTTVNAQESVEYDEIAECVDALLEQALAAGIDISEALLDENLRSTTRAAVRNVTTVTGRVARTVDNVGETVIQEKRKNELIRVRKEVMNGRAPISRYIKLATAVVAINTGILPPLAIAPLVSSIMRHKKMKNRERQNLLAELRTEMEIINEKIKDAEADNDRQKKYNYIRLRREIQRGIDQLKYGERFSVDRPSLKL